MPKGIMFVASQPASADREDEYNEWYSTVHLPEVCEVDGIVGARRYKLHGSATPGAGVSEYIAIYDLDADDLDLVMGRITERATSGGLTMTDALGMDPPPVPIIYELL